MKKAILATSLVALTTAGSAFAGTGAVPTGIPALEHVFVIVMENHAYGQINGNPDAPFINEFEGTGNLATNYYGVAHPSLTNYLEIVGGSNFNNHSDQYPDWHNTNCTPNIKSGITNVDASNLGAKTVVGLICPISGTGTDAATPVTDTTDNETSAPPLTNIDGKLSFAAASVVGKTIADQLVGAGKSWKSYQEGLPAIGADGVNVSDGVYVIGGANAAFINVSTDFSPLSTTANSVSASDIVYLYAVKHDPFAYFASVQEGERPALSLSRIVGFDGTTGLYADLRAGNVPSLAFIAPNQCNDQHGRGNGTAFCNFDADDNGTLKGLNPSLILQGDLEVERIITAIKSSSVWANDKSAIVLLWDENDYSTKTSNKVVAVVDTNYGTNQQTDSTLYTHFSLTKSLDGAFGLPCLNHACDTNVVVMKKLFN